MHATLNNLLAEAVQLELNVAHLYLLFHDAFPEDRDFWWQLMLEEKNHAALIRSANDSGNPFHVIVETMLASPELQELRDDAGTPCGMLRLQTTAQELRAAGQRVLLLTEQCRAAMPSRQTACQLALELEEAAGELHFQRFMERQPESALSQIFQLLNHDDRNHAERIRTYLAGMAASPA